MPKISGIVILIIIAIIGENSREICTNLWQSILFILDIMNDVIMYVGITDKIIAAVIFVAILIVFAIAGVSVSKKKRNKMKNVVLAKSAGFCFGVISVHNIYCSGQNA